MTSPSPLPPLALLAGGLATRLRPITETMAKSMIIIAAEPFIAHQLRYLKSQGISRVVICLGHCGDQLRNFVQNGSQFGMEVDYSLDGPTQLGTGGALKKALPKLGKNFFVMYGDSYLPTLFQPIAQAFSMSEKLALMTIYRNESHWDASNVDFRDGIIRVYNKRHKTPSMSYIDYGLGAFRSEVFQAYPAYMPLDLAEIYRDLLSRGQLAGYEVKERFYEIGSREGIRETDAFLKQRNPT